MYLRSQQAGFTVIEMLIAIALGVIALTMAVPSFTQVIHKNRVKGATETFYETVQAARAETIKRNQAVTLTLRRNVGDAEDWCFGLKDNGTCDCTVTNPAAANFCEVDGVQKIVRSASFPGVELILASPVAGTDLFGGTAGGGYFTSSMSFDPVRGVVAGFNNVNDNFAEFEATNGNRVRMRMISPLGRFQNCSPANSGDNHYNISDYAQCATAAKGA